MSEIDLFEPVPVGSLSAEQLRNIAETSPGYIPLSSSSIEDLAAAYQLVHVPGGKRLIAQGQRHAFQYTVLSGRMRAVRREANGQLNLLGDLARLEPFGLSFLLGDQESVGDVYAVRDSVLARLSRAEFERIGPRHPDLLMSIARRLVKGVARLFEGPKHGAIVNIAVVPASSDSRLSCVASALVDAADRSLSVAQLTAEGVESAVGEGVIEDGEPSSRERLTAWLDQQERSHDMVIYACDATPTAWNDTALRQADRVLICGAGGTAPDREHLRKFLPDRREDITAPKVDLLLVHDARTRIPQGTSAWLELGEFAGHHHVRVDRSDDFARVTRRLTGRSIGLVLGGGGARGIAHVGVIKALTESGVPIDYVGGTSMGSIVAAAWGMGMSAEQMLEKLRDTVAPKGALVDLTLPVIALTAGAKLERILRGIYGDLQIEDLWTPFFCNSTNLTQSRIEMHKRGSLWESIRASISMPAVFPPMHSDDSLLVDGGVLDNLPVTTMSQLCDGGQVIAVDVSDNRQADLDAEYKYTASGWRLIGRKLNPFRQTLRVPNIVELVTRCTVVASSRETTKAREQAALFLRPPVEEFGTLQFDALDEISRVGYEHAMERLADWSP